MSNIIRDSFDYACFPLTYLARHRPYILAFKTTGWCWYKCAHCCENSGAHQPREYIPANAVINYMDQAAADPLFSGYVVFTGGEIMSSYRFGDENYVKTLLDHAMKLNLHIDIKTNAGWVGTDIEERIYDDIAQTVRNNPNARVPQISLSLDKYHPNAIKKNTRFIHAMASRKSDIIFHISGFGDESVVAAQVADMLHRLPRHRLKLQEGYILPQNGDINEAQHVYKVNNVRIIWTATPAPFAAGRAVNLAAAGETLIPASEDSKFRIFERDLSPIVVLGQGGGVRLGEANPTNITARWCAADGSPRPLANVKNDVFGELRRAELKYMMQHRCFMVPHQKFK